MSDAVSRWEDKRWVKDICRHRKIESDFQSPIVEIVSNRALGRKKLPNGKGNMFHKREGLAQAQIRRT